VIILKVTLNPGFNIIGWILAGLIAGALAGRISRGRGYGCLGDIVVGLVGALIGGWVVGAFFQGDKVLHFLGTTLVALVGALILIFVLRIIGIGR
jgi:uncharacterized membrane protein YeaQ/YmgE (transglycosylase-associated protein family)